MRNMLYCSIGHKSRTIMSSTSLNTSLKYLSSKNGQQTIVSIRNTVTADSCPERNAAFIKAVINIIRHNQSVKFELLFLLGSECIHQLHFPTHESIIPDKKLQFLFSII